MNLIKVKIENFLSIKKEQTLKINNGITSLVGLNEAGKTSVLKAMQKINGEKILPNEKNKNMKNKKSYISGFFRLSIDEINLLNENLREINKLDTNNQYCVEIWVDDEDGTGYNLYYLDKDNKYVSVNEMLMVKLINKVKSSFNINENELNDTTDYADLINYLNKIVLEENIDKKLIDDLKVDVEEAKNDKWSEDIPKYEIIKFSSFDDVLKSKYSLDQIENDKKIQNIFKIAEVSLEEIKSNIENTEEFALQDIENKYIDVVTRKFKEIFGQVDSEFKLRIRIGSANKSIFFSTQDKTTQTDSIPIDDRSDGFKWYLSMYLTLYDYIENNDKNNKILLLDEPNLYLHAEAQKDLLNRVFKEEFKDLQIIYTTHSPYMIDASNTNSIKIVEKDEQTFIYNSTREYALKKENINDVDALTPLMTALHLNIANELIANANDNLVVVEGIQDMYLLKAMIKKLGIDNKFKNIKFMPCFGSEKVVFMFGYLLGLGYKTYILADEDNAGRKTIKVITNNEKNNPIKSKLFTYSLAFSKIKKENENKKIDILLENLLSTEDKIKYFPSKNTIFYKDFYDKIAELELENDTINNFQQLFNNILETVEEVNG